jgi:hypothetical protein
MLSPCMGLFKSYARGYICVVYVCCVDQEHIHLKKTKFCFVQSHNPSILESYEVFPFISVHVRCCIELKSIICHATSCIEIPHLDFEYNHLNQINLLSFIHVSLSELECTLNSHISVVEH